MNVTSISFQCTLCNHDSNSQIRYVLISNLKLSQLIKEAFNTVTDTVNIFAPFFTAAVTYYFKCKQNESAHEIMVLNPICDQRRLRRAFAVRTHEVWK